MNIREFVLEQGVDEDIGTLADAYIKAVLALDDQGEQYAALAPAVRSMISTVTSSLRKARRGSPGRYAPALPAPARRSTAKTRRPARVAEPWLAWLRDNSRAELWVPGQGKRVAADMTPDEWDRRAVWLENQARGVARQAETCRATADGLRKAGVTCARELLP